MERGRDSRAAALEADGKTVAAVFWEGVCLGLLALRVEPRPRRPVWRGCAADR